MKQTLRKLLRDEVGATAIEYGLLLAVFSTFVIFGLKSMAVGAGGLWNIVEAKGVQAMGQH
ncbi:Flp family type IVb pilin [Novosphingobium sp. KCTC 2891]|uniref:Flp family type IVb pilin n=1 Tax=Novosphingobium sp. KCTC 2891 TaxID=2989730 RepID=UPI002221F32C|nr:Flp family type IVb pilin [Novosphingobium sp. KCTC 2891]MCW1383484.1 Flp family type IVb pilin [Novosphingobium sp. KCTC 2891]